MDEQQENDSNSCSDNSSPGGYEVIVMDSHEPRDIFCQMDILRQYNDDYVWKELHRWVKFEEVLEEKGKRWSKPHVSSMYMQSLTELHTLLASNTCILDMEALSMYDIVDKVLEEWKNEGSVSNLLWNHLRALLLKKHKHQHVRGKYIKRHASKAKLNESKPKLSPVKEMSESVSAPNLHAYHNEGYESSHSNEDASSELLSFGSEFNDKFKRKIPEGAEVLNIMVGEVEELKNRRLCAFVRLSEAKDVGKITEVSLPTRFLFILLVPLDDIEVGVEIGRCIGTLMTDEIFREAAYRSTNKVEILSAVLDFTSHVTVLPPGCWDKNNRIEPPKVLPPKDSRANAKVAEKVNRSTEEDDDDDPHHDPSLERTGRLFGGLIQDVKRKWKWYRSDFTDAIHVQCFASFVYLFLATLTPNVTFGGLLGVATEQHMGTMECILAAAVTGIIFALFSGQPMNILGSTGPMLVLESILFNFCREQKWDFLSLRIWVGLWTALLLTIIVAFDLSSLVRYITRFTEESFACLIALIFIFEAFKKLIEIEHLAPVELHAESKQLRDCFCIFLNNTQFEQDHVASRHVRSIQTTPSSESTTSSGAVITSWPLNNCTENGGFLGGKDCHPGDFVPDVFFFSVLLFLGTFTIAYGVKIFRNSGFFPNFVRNTVGDFGVLIAIIVMLLVDILLGIPTPKLTVPSEFKPTRPDRGWIINPISDKNPWWLILASSIPAALATILIFLDQQITSVIVNRKENKLKKGGGYHLDLLVVAFLIMLLSFLGLPWFVAATVTAIAHVMSLRKESECTAPGEKPTFLGVREQRVTALLVGLFSGLAVLITSVLKHIPMPVLYGVFFYMGASALSGMQMVQRILIIFMPQKYQPDYKFLRHVPLTKVHLYTGIQVVCLAALWAVKSIKAISIVFPIMVLGICFQRKALDFIFTQHELKWLDELLPGSNIKKEKKPKLSIQNVQKPKTIIRSLSVPVYNYDVQLQPDLKQGLSISSESLRRRSCYEDIQNFSTKRKISSSSLPVNLSLRCESAKNENNNRKNMFDFSEV
ncbi:electroneutral sodium bicarbonate exchanger 1-like [Saccostrea cucullata]|uniref:electroneutral sodium bicarbonate exchanger 1-like n=1 Tax=Saccostrea cuccullata TaxID=36930 RepID=UPI002ED5CF1D